MAVPIRGELLPPEIKDSEIFFEDLDNETAGQLNKKGYSGFDNTGKYFTTLYGGHFSYTEKFRIQACVFKFDRERQKIRQKSIFIQMQYPLGLTQTQHRSVEMEFNPSSTDWFVLFGLNRSYDRTADSVPRKVINIYHGCLRPYLGTSRFIEIDVKNYEDNKLQLTYPYSDLYIWQRQSLLCHNKIYGSFLVIFLSQRKFNEATTNFTIDLVKYKETEISHFKRIEAKMERKADLRRLFFNGSTNIFYIYYLRDSPRQSEIMAYDFDGNVLFTHVLPNDVQLSHIENSLFVDTSTVPATVINITQDRLNIVTIRIDYELAVNSPKQYSYTFIKALGTMFIELNQKLDQNRGKYKIISKLYNFYTGEKLFENQRNSNGPCCWYNWHMGEIAKVEVHTRHMRIDRRIQEVEEKALRFEKLQTNDSISLKHLARMTCMKWLSREYMNERLPNGLKQYVGIEK